jgi:hypothetical protein
VPDDAVTRPDLQNFETRLERKLDSFEARIVDHVHEAVRASEARILKAIYELAESGNKRMTALERSHIGLIEVSPLLRTAS